MFGVSSCLEGWLLHRMSWIERIAALAGGLLLIYPGLVTDLIGLAIVAVVVLVQVATKKRALA
jgi:TRAP-type uncharacterized transport system fused permease subunit